MRLAPLALAILAGVAVPPCLLGQDEDRQQDEKELNRVWRIEGLNTAFCVQLLLDPAQLDVPISRAATPLRADAIESLNPVLKTVIANQPEFAAWSPSSICLYYMDTVDVGSLLVSGREPSKRPMLGVWTLAATDVAGGSRRDVVLRIFTNTGRLERAGQVSGLDIHTIRSSVFEIENEEDPDAPPIGIRHEIKLGKTLLTWSGRPVSDSTRANGPLSVEWRADSRRRGPMTARLVLRPDWTKAMVGSLQVEGKDDFARAVKASPIRFVGPAMLGGGGELAFGR
ncbi:MAG TPA: hypothetical protein VG500_08805 [Gemmatimonadales bacterium]|jgi:hypothetical protein|nr:hypothetical protein [Gemmatimonadales bacterium]